MAYASMLQAIITTATFGDQWNVAGAVAAKRCVIIKTVDAPTYSPLLSPIDHIDLQPLKSY